MVMKWQTPDTQYQDPYISDTCPVCVIICHWHLDPTSGWHKRKHTKVILSVGLAISRYRIHDLCCLLVCHCWQHKFCWGRTDVDHTSSTTLEHFGPKLWQHMKSGLMKKKQDPCADYYRTLSTRQPPAGAWDTPRSNTKSPRWTNVPATFRA